MPMTLTESAKYTQSKLYQKIVEEIVKASPIMTKLPFIEVPGTSLTVNYEDVDTPTGVDFYGVNDTITESTGGILQKTFSLTKLIGDAEVDNFIKKSRSNIFDIWAEQIKLKAKAMAHKMEQTLIYGGASGSNEFNGLHSSTLMPAAQRVHAGSSSTGDGLTTTQLDELCDLVSVGGAGPDLIIMNRKILRRLSQYLRTVGSYQTTRDEWGNLWHYWQDVPIMPSDFLLQTETISGSTYALPTTGACSSVFAMRFGAGDGLCGIQSGGLHTEKFDKLERKDASLVRMLWYVGLALFQSEAVARIDGILDEAITA
jgi:hypothetical protein